ncbi:glycosyltransferase WbuB [Porphyrobacter sp. HT-58-2]|uniref:glycosyltransferase family 4 protein n=1 Tax=Porphyrobacter sp. HT-58-2 TaxID=2023229 RepID=UPI000CDC1080|nr:glycosyltransferase family 4 protein [Porphyrobacter sp. HT-58-2]AUX69625.1 glycosyltransferase WbuB [Porphyrobacter sp. HT-58-2]
MTMAAAAADGWRQAPRLILLTQWFDPEPTFKGLVFARALLARGYDVEVVTGFPNYPGGKVFPGYKIRPMQRTTVGGIAVTRLALYPSHDAGAVGRVLNYVTFFLTAWLYLTFVARRADIVYVYHPPLTVGLAAVGAKFFRRTPTVIDIQDMWPDTLAATGMIANARALRVIGALCRWLYRRVNHIVVLSPGFRRLLIERGVPKAKISVIPNWADEAAIGSAAASGPVPDLPGRFRLLFAGNMGRAQKLDTVLDAATLLRNVRPDIAVILLGGGLEVPRLQARTSAEGLSNVHFLPAVPMAEVGAYLAAADALLVHLRDDPLFAITIPSKMQAYLAAGRPMIMGVAGDAAEITTAAAAGLVVPSEAAEALASAIETLADMPAERRAAMGEAGRRYYDTHLSLDHGVAAFDNVFRSVMRVPRTSAT